MLITEEQFSDLVFDLPSEYRELGKLIMQKLRKGDVEVPIFPSIATQVMQLANTPESGAGELAALIQTDPMLAGHVMRVANSPLYTPNASMVSLQQAIARLGMTIICEISLTVALNSKLFNAPGYEQRLSDISLRGVCTALWAKEIARQAQVNVEAAFLCGLLHNIGRAAFLQVFADTVSASGVKTDEAYERALEDTLQSTFGKEISEIWEMPEVVCATAGCDSEYAKPLEDGHKYQQQVATVHAASIFADMSLNDSEPESLFEDGALKDLNLYQDQIEALLAKSEFIVATVKAHQS